MSDTQARHEHEHGAPLTADCDNWCRSKYELWSQAQAEDRRAQIQAGLEVVKQAYRDSELSILQPHHLASWDDIEWLLAELSRLSRVEQALREALTDIVDDLEARWDMRDPRTNPGIVDNVKRAKVALSASPEAQPKEGR